MTEPAITDEGRRPAAGPHRRRPAPSAAALSTAIPGTDAFRHVAEAYGDDNPLWCDPDYAATTVWGGPIASPHLNGGDTLIGENEVAALDAETKALAEGRPAAAAPTPTTPAASASGGSRCDPATRVTRRNALVGVHDKASEFAERTVHEWTGEVFAAPDHVLSAQYRLMIRTDRDRGPRPKGKYDDTTIEPYTDEEIERITEAVGAEVGAPAWRRAPMVGGRRRGRRARSAREGAAAGDRHRRAGTSAWAWVSTG